MSFENSELRAFETRLAGAPGLLAKDVKNIVMRGAGNIQRQQRSAARKSRHFGQIAPAVTFDVREGGAFGGGFVEAEIGPRRGSPGSLANIAYFGTSRGGGTVEDPKVALEAEEPKFTQALGDAMIDAIERG